MGRAGAEDLRQEGSHACPACSRTPRKPLLPALRRLCQVPSRGLPPRLGTSPAPSPGGAGQAPLPPSALRHTPAFPRHGAPTRQPAGAQHVQGPCPGILTICSEPVLRERSPGRHFAAFWPAEQLRAAPAAHGVLDTPGAESWWAREEAERGRGGVSHPRQVSQERTPVPSRQKPR